jgi:hypothetical protein
MRRGDSNGSVCLFPTKDYNYNLLTIGLDMFLGLLDPDLQLPVSIQIWHRIRILPLTSKKLRNTLISAVWRLDDFLSLNANVNVPTESNKQNKLLKTYFCWHLESH